MTTTSATLHKADSAALRVVAWLAAAAFAVTTVGLIVTIAAILLGGETTVTGSASSLAPSAPVVTALTGGPVSAVAATVDVTVHDAPPSVRAPLVAAAVTGALVPLSVSAVIFFLGRQLAQGRIRRQLGFGAAFLAVATFASALFTPFLNAVASTEALKLGPAGADAPFSFALSGDDVALPTLLLVLGATLFVSERLQKDTEGLV
ncbi:hypothetical protein ACI3KS_14880 [Microbacterium sp. ZW T5_45]|uniref:hypothetical protein n=1 Tax=Microbacterium sp. ZW T5_45 TaxID=3378080 RepID=UPI003852D143